MKNSLLSLILFVVELGIEIRGHGVSLGVIGSGGRLCLYQTCGPKTGRTTNLNLTDEIR